MQAETRKLRLAGHAPALNLGADDAGCVMSLREHDSSSIWLLHCVNAHLFASAFAGAPLCSRALPVRITPYGQPHGAWQAPAKPRVAAAPNSPVPDDQSCSGSSCAFHCFRIKNNHNHHFIKQVVTFIYAAECAALFRTLFAFFCAVL